MASQRLKKKMK